MKRKCWGSRLGVATVLVCGGGIALTVNPVFAQITPDGTLGTEGSIVTPNTQIRGFPADLIEGGAFRGSALFHSFAEFNVNNGQRIYFANPTGIENIFSRVTGNNPSDILGTLGVNGAANLYLLNPNGIIFGNNAQLDVAGSFVATTANRLVFNNGCEFSATNPQAPPLLAINVTPGLQYGSVTSGVTIANSGNLTAGKDLTLLADNLNLQGELNAGGNLNLQGATVQIRDSAVKPFIAAASGNLLIEGTRNIDIFALNHPNSGLFSNGNLILRSGNTVGGDAHFTAGGSFIIEQLDGNLGNLFSPNDPVIRATGDVVFGGYQGASLHIFAGGSVTIPGGVFIGAGDPFFRIVENVTLSDGTQIAINGKTTPTLDIRAGTNAVGNPGIIGIPPLGKIDSLPPIPTPIPTSANITIGNIINQGGMVFLTNQYNPNLSLPGGGINVTGSIITGNPSGNGGSVTIDSRNNIALNDLVNTSSGNLLQGKGGDIALISNSDITTSEILSLGGLGGNINLTSQGKISVNDRLISSISLTPIIGTRGGDINIKARSLLLTDGGRIVNSTITAANGGDFNVNTSESIEATGETSGLNNSALLTTFPLATNLLTNNPGSGLYAITGGTGNSGNITIETGRLIARNGGEITTFTFGSGSGGNLQINAKESVELIDTGVKNIGGLFTESRGLGNAGNIKIDTGRLIIQGGQNISTTTFVGGRGGDLTVNASESVEAIGVSPNGQSASFLAAATLGSGKAGDLVVNTRRLSLRDGGFLAAVTLGKGDGGNLTVNASESVEVIGKSPINLIPSGIAIDTFNTLNNPTGSGNAGNLRINTRRLLVRDGALISASTFSDGKGGNLFVNASESIELSGKSAEGFPSGLYAQGFGKGNAGNLEVTTGELTVRDGAKITVATGTANNDLSISNPTLSIGAVQGLIFPAQATGNAGTMTITANSIFLDKQGQLIAKTISGEGGNISLNARDLILLRRESLISAEAFGGKGDGGNIIIDPPFVIGLENSDIVADAFGGDGGNINITAQSIIGLKFRPFRTPLNDITASSQFGDPGPVFTNTPKVDPSSGLVELPDELADVQRLVDPTCKADIAENQSQFVVTGRGGLPPKPNETLRGEGILTDWVSLDSEIGDRKNNLNSTPVQSSTPKRIVEAQGWVVNRDGTVILTADASNLTPDNPQLNPTTCH
ncbi:two-partner secretion domain-containing protein [Limnofasciculus baicalensis]|uniref:Filamentous hemagglutinin N-terminal domain-containing protein n=1 Tax=Limnofasciculus baicalensis BBK-W-15 TaxID=2699891 RepID=A0AAE3GP07_9CYAN|nr:filamentous hemagglutinin N-terminal domain-containing protein [Limnofasciculus baicalensis]MCP2728081.1 filamentous hemagglutinin N-terminal domain-containing protein [Limnofasciculus baicalensis BBK-W-15]